MNNSNNISDNRNVSFTNVNNTNSSYSSNSTNRCFAIKLSLVAIIISIITLVFSLSTYTFDINTIIPILGVMITVLITWQIYNSVDINKRVNEYDKRINDLNIEMKTLYNRIDKSELMAETLSYISYTQKYQVGAQSYTNALKSIGIHKYYLVINSAFYFLQCIKLLLKIRLANKVLQRDMLHILQNRISDCADIVENISELSSNDEFKQAYDKYSLKDELKSQISYIRKFLNEMEVPTYIEEVIKNICYNIDKIERDSQ